MKIHLVIVGTLATVCSQVFLCTVTYAQSAAEQSVCQQDGSYAVFAQHPLYQGAWGRGGSDGDRPNSPVGDTLNLELSHEHIFFCNNGRVTDNVGFGPGGRFSYPDEALRTGQEANGGRVDNFIPIDNEQYDSEIIREIIGFLPDSCELQNDGVYGGIINNCQGWTTRVREEYWRRSRCGIQVTTPQTVTTSHDGSPYTVWTDYRRGQESIEPRACGRQYWLKEDPDHYNVGILFVYLVNEQNQCVSPYLYREEADGSLTIVRDAPECSAAFE